MPISIRYRRFIYMKTTTHSNTERTAHTVKATSCFDVAAGPHGICVSSPSRTRSLGCAWLHGPHCLNCSLVAPDARSHWSVALLPYRNADTSVGAISPKHSVQSGHTERHHTMAQLNVFQVILAAGARVSTVKDKLASDQYECRAV